jgi:N-acetylneuraminic acid mutarotase
LATIGDNSYFFTENVSLGLASLDSGGISLNGQNARAIVNSKLYVFDTESGPTRVFEIDQGNLVEKAPLMRMPTARFAAATLVTENDEIFVFGGKQTRPNGTSRLINRLESFNPLADTWNRHRNIPGINQREGAALAAASIGNKPYAFLLGGGVLQRNRLFGSVAGYDFMLNRWQTKGMTPMPTPRAFLSNIQAPVLNGKIYLIGGKSLNGAGGLIKSNKVEIYDPVSNTWQIGPDLPQEIREPLPFTDGNKLFVLDGLNNADNGKMTVWELDDAWIGSLEVGETCDLDGDGRFTNRDVNLFARACRTETAYWNCDLIGNGASIAKNTREYRRQWREHMNRACP